ncbi:hypothetical protein EJ03DRAFT_65076 [Teratosphaeria nubilosa]|uniref:F-box domain-containing protein n=1 Tax=Teratosphaeria nubilosa TaxID=161662 RepID=A0A6G1LCH5_9PEZI|nr:hypothetical protein EJ03DRAFT_65076 [Teratosphaeria nubilosa]
MRVASKQIRDFSRAPPSSRHCTRIPGRRTSGHTHDGRMAVLLDLPQELLVRVASYLTTAELGPLRRTCKAVEKGLFKTFAREFFTKRQFMIEHVSLQALVDIANHKTLTPYLKEVIIGTQHLYYDPNFLNHQGGRHREAGYMERSLFVATGQAHAMLVEAFSKLPNLRTVGLRDYDGAGRLRDGDSARWKSYGWSFGDPPQTVHWDGTQRPQPPDPIFGSLLFALGKARSNIEGVEVFLRRQYQLTLFSFYIVQGPTGDTVDPRH